MRKIEGFNSIFQIFPINFIDKSKKKKVINKKIEEIKYEFLEQKNNEL